MTLNGRLGVVLIGVMLLGSGCASSPTRQPQAWPGALWTKNGAIVPPLIIDAAAGPSPCDGWQSATFLTLGWPLGRRASFSTQARQYVRDPRGVVDPANLRSHLDLHATLPPDARPTGYFDGGAQLYVAPSNEDVAIYIVEGSTVERWPRSDPMTTCS